MTARIVPLRSDEAGDARVGGTVEERLARPRRTEAMLEGVRVPVLSLEDLIANKRASGRDKDRVDVKGLEGRS